MEQWLRPPYQSELDYFLSNPNVAGMATEDNRVIFNPTLPEKSRESVFMNELARIALRNRMQVPEFSLTPRQDERFRDYGKPEDIRSTILARILAGDPSAEDYTDEQSSHVEQLRKIVDVLRKMGPAALGN